VSRRTKPLLQDDQVAKSQPNLPFDPMPDRVEPCLALLKTTAPTGSGWAYEVKSDGYRLALHIEPKGFASLRVVAMTGPTGFRQLQPQPRS